MKKNILSGFAIVISVITFLTLMYLGGSEKRCRITK